MGELKQYEREIVRARSRVEVAELDGAIDALIVDLIGRLTKREHKTYQAVRLTGLIGATPELIVARRGLMLGLTDAQIAPLTAPDVLTMEEEAELVLIMRAIVEWLQACQAAGESSIPFAHLCGFADRQALAAGERFSATYGRPPHVSDLPDSVMRIPRARSIVKLAEKTGVLLPPSRSEEHQQ